MQTQRSIQVVTVALAVATVFVAGWTLVQADGKQSATSVAGVVLGAVGVCVVALVPTDNRRVLVARLVAMLLFFAGALLRAAA